MSHSDVSMVVLPGKEGMVGVLPNHSNCLIGLQPGIIKVYKNKDITKRYILRDGTATIDATSCTITTQEFHELDELDPKVLEEGIKRYHDDLAGIDIEIEERVLQAKIKATEKMLDVARQHFKK
jgi:F-type H+-transporting ATPase subunit epsilon